MCSLLIARGGTDPNPNDGRAPYLGPYSYPMFSGTTFNRVRPFSLQYKWDELYMLKGKFSKQQWIGWFESDFRYPTVKFEHIGTILLRIMILQCVVWIPMSPSLDDNSARISDTTREQLSTDWLCTILPFIFLDRSVDYFQSLMQVQSS